MSSAPIEHDKPLEARTYEQTSMLDAYLYFHFGDLSPLKYTQTPSSTYTISSPSDDGQSGPNYGDFGYYKKDEGVVAGPFGGDFITSIPNFPKQVAQMAIHWYQKLNTTDNTNLKAIDIGCSVGRTCFELAEFFPKVTGLDFSRLFVNTGAELAGGAKYSYKIPLEGELAFSAEYSYKPTEGTAIDFIEGDACHLDNNLHYKNNDKFQKFNCITGANLIDRLPLPINFLHTLPEIVETDGIVVLTSPYTWLEQYTPRNEWLPNLALDQETGQKIQNSNTPTQKTTFEALHTIMKPNFELVHQSHIPFFIHETVRKAQYSLAHCTVWRRRK